MSDENGGGGELVMANEELALVLTRQELLTMLKIAEEVSLPAAQAKMIVASFQVKAMAALESE